VDAKQRRRLAERASETWVLPVLRDHGVTLSSEEQLLLELLPLLPDEVGDLIADIWTKRRRRSKAAYARRQRALLRRTPN
jgi:hypothetical protein